MSERPEATQGAATLAVLMGSAAAVLAAFAMRVVLARRLGPGDFGLFTEAVAIATAAGGCAALGLGSAAARRVSLLRVGADPRAPRQAAGTAIATGALSGIAGALLVVALAPWVARIAEKPDLTAPLWALAPVVAALAVGQATLGVARAFGNTLGRALWRDALGGLWRALGVFAALALGAGLTGAALGFAAGSLVGELGFVGYAAARGWWRVPLGGPRWDRELLRSLPPYAGMAVVYQGAQWFDILLLGVLAPAAAVGIYGVARGLERVLELGGEAGAHRFLPAATEALHREGVAALAGLYLEARAINLALLLPPLLLCLLAPGPLLVAVFGAAYAPAAAALRLLAAGLLFSAVFGYNDRALLAAGDEVAVARITLGALVVGALIAVGLVHSHGILGGAAGWSAMVALQNLLWARRLARRVGVGFGGRELLELAARVAGPALALFVALRAGGFDSLAAALTAAAAAGILGLLRLRRRWRRARSADSDPDPDY
ncbi:MAG: oligosaccharide flippase family protein [Acidobacteriota bacterium]